MNKAGALLHGSTEADIVGKTVDELMPPDLASTVAWHDAEVWRTGMPHTYDEKVGDGPGAVHIFGTLFPLVNAEGTMVALGGVLSDVGDDVAPRSHVTPATPFAA